MSNIKLYKSPSGKGNVSGIKNYVLAPLALPMGSVSAAINPYMLPNTMRDAKLMQYYMMPIQLDRVAHDISMWRNAVTQAENALLPTRYFMQRMFVDSILEGHTFACMKKRKRLTSLKDFVIRDEAGNFYAEYTKIFKDKQWFTNLLEWILDAQFYGYSLIQLGDMILNRNAYSFPRMMNLRRWNVEPDRQNLVSIPLQKTGVNFLDESVKDDSGRSYADWSIYVDTPTDIGHSICGYGLLYQVALYGIILKNNLSNHADYTQMFAQPYRHAKTSGAGSLDGQKRANLEKSLSDMGASGWIITDDGITIDFKETNTGTGFQAYENLTTICQKLISKIILGHADAIDATVGKLGSSQGGKQLDQDLTPAGQALTETEKDQDKWCMSILNDIVLPKFRNLGIKIPDDLFFGTTKDKEEFEARKKADDANLVTATVFNTIKQAGGKPDWKQFSDITGLNVEEAPTPEPTQQIPFLKNGQQKQAAKLIATYRNISGVMYSNKSK